MEVARVTIKLLPPYRKAGESGEYVLDIARETTLAQLAAYLHENWTDRLAYALFDKRGNLTAEFMLNGKPASVKEAVRDGDTVTVFPYLAGGWLILFRH